jgi:cysteine desulfurase family protein
MIYLDNAATSWPKPDGVAQAMVDFMRESGANPGRGGHTMSLVAGRTVFRCREALSTMFNIADSSRVVFTQNATAAINTALFGLLQAGDHCVTSSWEHNAVSRPLQELQRRGIDVSVVSCDADGSMDPQKFADAMRPNTRLVAVMHASNVTGAVFPAKELAQVAHAGGALFLLDAAQTAGAVPIDVRDIGVDLMAAPGHKSLLGPMGTGILYVAPDVSIRPTVFGGTGSHSESLSMPEDYPDRLEAGTLNAPGLAGLHVAVNWLLKQGVANIHAREQEHIRRLRESLADLPGVIVYGKHSEAPVMAFNITHMSSVEVSSILDASFGICTRSGLHCAPLAHRTLGTLDTGAVRVSPGPFTTDEDITSLIEAVGEVARC